MSPSALLSPLATTMAYIHTANNLSRDITHTMSLAFKSCFQPTRKQWCFIDFILRDPNKDWCFSTSWSSQSITVPLIPAWTSLIGLEWPLAEPAIITGLTYYYDRIHYSVQTLIYSIRTQLTPILSEYKCNLDLSEYYPILAMYLLPTSINRYKRTCSYQLDLLLTFKCWPPFIFSLLICFSISNRFISI